MDINESIHKNLSEFSQNNKIWKPNILVLGPGGVKGYLELGFLLKLYQDNYLNKINGFVGCSVGSAISLMIISGYSISEIIDDCINLNLVSDLGDLNLENLRQSPGLLKIKNLENLIKQRIIQKFNRVPTLNELFLLTNVSFIVVTFNLDKMRKEYLSKDTDPDLSCVEAIMMSMAIPALICPRIYKGNTYVDGAVGDPYPVLELDNGTNNILGIYIDSESYPHKDFFSHLYRCAQASMKILRDQSIELASNKCRHVALKTSILDSIGLYLTEENKRNMIDTGYSIAVSFLNKSDDNDELTENEDDIFISNIIIK